MLIAAVAVVTLANGYQAFSNRGSTSPPSISSLSSAMASGEQQGIDEYAKLNRVECPLPGNVFFRVINGTINCDVNYTTAVEATAGGQYGSYFVVEGSLGYFSDCEFYLFDDCDKSLINFHCRI